LFDARECHGKFLTGDVAQDRIVLAAGVDDGHAAAAYVHHALSSDEVPIQFRRVAIFKSPQAPGKHGVERVGDHCHHHVEVHLDEDWRVEGVARKNVSVSLYLKRYAKIGV